MKKTYKRTYTAVTVRKYDEGLFPNHLLFEGTKDMLSTLTRCGDLEGRAIGLPEGIIMSRGLYADIRKSPRPGKETSIEAFFTENIHDTESRKLLNEVHAEMGLEPQKFVDVIRVRAR